MSEAWVAGVVGGAVGGVGSTLLGWYLNRRHERNRLWAEYAFKCTELHYELQQKQANASGQPVHALAAVKTWRELFKALEHFDRHKQWPMHPQEQRLLDVVSIPPEPAYRSPPGSPPAPAV